MESALHALIDRITQAHQTRTPLRIRGGGSKDFLGHSLQGEILDTRRLSGIRAYEPSELVVTAAAGTPLAELEAALREKNQYLPFEPPHFGWSQSTTAGNAATHAKPLGERVQDGGSAADSAATHVEPLGERVQNSGPAAGSAATVGGMVAAGLAGPARATAGSVRDYVLGVQMVNGLGQHLTFGGQVIKNVAGYDVSRLMAGAMGTLGLITEVSLKVLPLPAAEATLVFQVGQAAALEQLHRWGGQPLPLNASCWVRDDTAPGQPELLFVRLRGAAAAVEAACQRMLAELPGKQMDTAVAAPDWAQLRDQTLPFFTAPGEDRVLWRLSLPPTAPVLDLPWPQLVEWQGGLRWVWAPPEAAAALQAAARRVGGNASIFIATDAQSARANATFGTENSAALAIARRVKQNFDPHGIFNPQRLYPDF